MMQMNEVIVSVILPVYNAEDYVTETIESVLNQSYKNFEFIIVDHACTDSSSNIIAQFLDRDKRIKVIKLDINKGGPAYPRNVAMKVAQGEYLAFIDSDDLWMPEKLELQMNFMAQQGLNFTSSNIYVIDEKSKNRIFLSMLYRIKLSYRSYFKSQCAFVMNNFIMLPSVMIKRDLINSFNEEEDYIAAEDYALWLSLLGRDDVSYGLIRKPLIRYRFGKNSLSGIGGNKQQVRALRCTVDYMLLENRLDLYNCIRLTLAKKYIVSIIISLLNKIFK